MSIGKGKEAGEGHGIGEGHCAKTTCPGPENASVPAGTGRLRVSQGVFSACAVTGKGKRCSSSAGNKEL